MKTFNVWQNAWKDDGETPLTITLPDDWEVEYHEIPADSMPVLTQQQLREKIFSPIGMESIGSLASKGERAVIVFDDLSRGTPVKKIAPIVLDELLTCGVKRENINFLCAIGLHAAHTRADFVKKLGKEIVENYPIYCHNPFENNLQVGTDSYGKVVSINRGFMECDIRIGIGSIMPHHMNGFGGGGKLLFPGIASMETTATNHGRLQFQPPGSTDAGGFRREIENMTRMVAPFYKIDAILNSKLDIVDLFAGDPIQEYCQGIQVSAKLHAMEIGRPKDIVVVNANAKYNESMITVALASQELKEGGDIVMINHCPSGMVLHYLYGVFGKGYGGRCWIPHEKRLKHKYRRVIYYTPYPDYNSKLVFDDPDSVIFATTWEDVLDLLSHHKTGTTASVLPDGSMSYFREKLM